MMARAVRHVVEHVAFRISRAGVRLLPDRVASAVGAFLGWLAGSVLRFRRSDTERHLVWALPDLPVASLRKLARDSYAHFGREAAIVLRMGAWTPERIRRATRVSGFEAFAKAAGSGGGVVLLTGHLGNWEVGGAAIAARGIPLDVVGKGMSNRRFERDLFAGREELGMRVISMGEAPKRVPRSLGEGRVVALLGDQSAHRSDFMVDFFGRPAATARGPAVFALRHGAPVFVAFALREPGSTPTYAVRFERLTFEVMGDLEADARTLTEAYNARLQEAIRQVPEQYFWQHRRWKGVPVEEPVSGG